MKHVLNDPLLWLGILIGVGIGLAFWLWLTWMPEGIEIGPRLRLV